MARAPKRARSSSTTSSQPVAGNGVPTTSSGGFGFVTPGAPRWIIPAPARIAARAHRCAAPTMPPEPATMRSAVSHL